VRARLSLPALTDRLPQPAPFLYKYAFALMLFVVVLTGYEVVGHATEGAQHSFMTDLDRQIPYLPWTVWLYLPLFAVYFHLAIYSIRRWDVFFKGVASMVLVSLMAWAIFLVLPSSYPRPPVMDDGSLTGKLLVLLRSIDPATNTFPSLHVGMTLTVALACRKDDLVRGRWMLVLAAVPSLSILTMKQHYVIDLLGGLAVGLASHVLVFRGNDAEAITVPVQTRQR
jgi:membrane-associated phospholipid phosphatase